MKKIISQILLVLLIITVGLASVFITKVNAQTSFDVTITAATEGENFTIQLAITDPTIGGVNCDVQVVFSDGSVSKTSVKGETGIAWAKIEGDTYGSDSITFLAKVPGTARVRLTNINISDADAQPLDGIKTLEKTITIKAKEKPPAEQPSNPSTPTEPSKPEEKPDKPATGNTTSDTKNQVKNETVKNEIKNTTKEPEVKMPKFKDVNETVYALKSCNVRSSCSTSISSNKIGQLVQGQKIKRTGVEDTWSRIEFNGKVAYVATRLLSLEEPEEEIENVVENKISNNVVSNNIVENEVENGISREEMLNQLERDIGVLPEVGNNIATTIFIILSIATLVVVMVFEYKSKIK